MIWEDLEAPLELCGGTHNLYFSIQLEVKIPLVQLTFPSVAGMKRIPKKRPAPTPGEDSPTAAAPPEPKKRKQDTKVSCPGCVFWGK